MKHFEDFRPTGTSFAQRVGLPEEFHAALGQVVLNFAYLDDTVSNVVLLLMSAEPEVARIALSEAPFRTKLDMLGSLANYRISQLSPDDRGDSVEWFRDLVTICRKAEQLLNIYLRSSYPDELQVKTTSKARRGLASSTTTVDSELLLDVADFMADAGMSAEGAPMVLGLADRVSSTGSSVTYSLNGEVVAVFRATSR